MFDVEIYILQSVRWHLQHHMHLSNEGCDIEPDEDIAATSGDVYLGIIPAGVVPGPAHGQSGQVRDVVYSFQVTAYRRIAATANDRRSSVYLREATGVNALLSRVIELIDWSASVQYYATALMQAEHPDWPKILGTPRFVAADNRPTMLVSKTYEGQAIGGKGTTPFIGFKRSVTFGGMRWQKPITQP